MTEGFDTADLREANALLDELACVASPALAFAAILLESTLAVRPSSEQKTYLDDLTRQPGRMSDCRWQLAAILAPTTMGGREAPAW